MEEDREEEEGEGEEVVLSEPVEEVVDVDVDAFYHQINILII